MRTMVWAAGIVVLTLAITASTGIRAEDLGENQGAPQVANVVRRVMDDPARREFSDGSITLTVHDGAGALVEDADVSWLEYDDSSPEEAPKKVGKGRTGKDGVYAIPNLRSRGYHLHVSKGDLGWWGYLPLHKEQKNPSKAVTIGVYRSIEGRVLDDTGAGLSGVQLLVRRGLLAGVSDAQGHFRIPNLEEQVQVSLFKEGYGWIELGLTPATALLELKLEKGGRARFKVLDPSGKPSPNVSASYWSADKEGGGFGAQTTTDSEGCFTTTWLSVTRATSANAGLESDGVAYEAKTNVELATGETIRADLRLAPTWHFVIDDKPDKKGRTHKVYTRINPQPSARVSGRVIRAYTKEPVQASICYGTSLEWVRGKQAHTAQDGTFSVEGMPVEKLFITAVPDDLAYYCVGGLVPIDLTREKSIEGLEFHIGQGCAIRGKVLSVDGLPYRAHVYSQPTHDNHYHAIWSSAKDGAFLIPNLPPSVDGYYVVRADNTPGHAPEVKVGPLALGAVAEDVVVQFTDLHLEEHPLGSIKGIVVDTKNQPVSGLTVALPTAYSAKTATTDDAGRFELSYNKTGTTELNVGRYTSVQIEGMAAVKSGPCDVVEGGQVVLGEGASSLEARVIVRVDEVRFVAGTIVDEQGKPFDPRHMNWFFSNGEGDWHSHEGQFFKADFPEGPVALLFEHEGYRSVYLESGRDFNWGNRNLRVVMVKRPFPEFESVFGAVTGHPASERNQLPRGKRIWDYAPTFRYYAGNDKSIWLIVRDSAGNPIKQITLRGTSPDLPIILNTVQTASAPDLTKISSPDGRYKLQSSNVFVSSPGYGCQWFTVEDQNQEAEPNFLTLSPEATVTVTVLNTQGKPYEGAHAAVNKKDPNWPHFIDTTPPTPKVDASGQMTFANLSPGEYEFWAMDPGQHTHRKSILKVESGKSYSLTLRFDQ